MRPDKTWEFIVEKAAPQPEKEKRKIEGDDLSQIANLVDGIKTQLVKSEFETEAAYISRIRDLLAATKNPISGRNLDETVFVFDGQDRYDAETQKFRVLHSKYSSPVTENKLADSDLGHPITSNLPTEHSKYFG